MVNRKFETHRPITVMGSADVASDRFLKGLIVKLPEKSQCDRKMLKPARNYVAFSRQQGDVKSCDRKDSKLIE